MASQQKICSSCGTTAPVEAHFCPNCGKPMISPSTSISKQILIYLISLFIAPFGLGYAWQYLKQSDKKSKKIGITAIILTIIGITLTIFIYKSFLQSYVNILNSIGI
ncbi:MAG TPA: zinc-ribbon domain-containing protein [Candidatus Paceibacterota bacterium]